LLHTYWKIWHHFYVCSHFFGQQPPSYAKPLNAFNPFMVISSSSMQSCTWFFIAILSGIYGCIWPSVVILSAACVHALGFFIAILSGICGCIWPSVVILSGGMCSCTWSVHGHFKRHLWMHLTLRGHLKQQHVPCTWPLMVTFIP
jgi:hypothetical protein